MFERIKTFLENRRLKFDILTSFVIIQMFTASFILYYSYTNNRDTLLEFSNKMMENLSANKIRLIADRLNHIQMSVNLGSYLITGPESIAPDNKGFISYMMAMVNLQPYLESIYVGTEGGRFLQVRVMEQKAAYRSVPEKLLPKTAHFGMRILDQSAGKKTELWMYLDDESRVVEKEFLPEGMITLDHKVREWYTKPFQLRGPVWTNVFVFNSSHKAGVAYAYPLTGSDGQYFGVISTTIHLDTFSSLLKENLPSGFTAVLNRKGDIIAHSNEETTIKNRAGEIVLATTEDLKDKTLHEAYQIHENQNLNQFIFNHDEKEYIATFKSMEGIADQEWVFVTVIPMDTFIGRVKEIQKMTLIICFFILMISIIIITFIARRIAQPIMTLAEQASRIKHFDLSMPRPIKSGIFEIQALEKSLLTMRRSLIFFNKFVPKTLVQKLVDKNPEIKLGGKSRKITILFTDIISFTSISEATTPDRLMAHLSEYLDELTRIILSEGGTVDKYIGDAIMAFWGAPDTDRDHALHACRAALLCQHKLVELNRKWSFEKKPNLPTRMGLHTGDVIAGFVGSSERINYTIFGDAVNLASRLEGVNKIFHTSILISEDTYRLIKDHAVARPIDYVTVKGKAHDTKIYELVAMGNSNAQLIPTQDQVLFCDLFTKGFDLFMDRHFKEALEIFKKITDLSEKDYVTNLYRERCQNYIENPPADDWSRITHLDTK